MMYKLTDKAIKERFSMLTGYTIEHLNIKLDYRVKNADPDEVLYFDIPLSRYVVAFKNAEMNKLDVVIPSYTFRVFWDDIEEVSEPAKEIAPCVWYDVNDLISGKYALDKAIAFSYDALACYGVPSEIEHEDNFTTNFRSFRLGYIDKFDTGYVLREDRCIYDLKDFERIMFIPAETEVY